MGKIYRSCTMCTNKARTGEITRVTFHRFPADNETRYIWMKICGLIQNMDYVCKLFVCSDHFVEDDYLNPKAREFGKPLLLKPGAFPTISVPNPTNIASVEAKDVADTFSSPASSGEEDFKEEVAMVPIEEILSVQSDNLIIEYSDSEPEVSSTPKGKRFHSPRYVGDLSLPDLKTPRQAKQSLQLVKDTIKKKNLQIRKLQQQNRRFRKKIEFLNSLLQHLKEGNLCNNVETIILDNTV